MKMTWILTRFPVQEIPNKSCEGLYSCENIILNRGQWNILLFKPSVSLLCGHGKYTCMCTHEKKRMD